MIRHLRIARVALLAALLVPVLAPFPVSAVTEDEEGTQLHLESPVVRSLVRGDDDALRRALFGGTDPNLRDIQRQPLIVLAGRHGRTQAVELLLENRARVDESDAFGNTALMWAADRDHVDIVRRLLNAGARVDMQNGQGMTALMRAVRHGRARSVEVLLDAGADVHLTDYTGRDALSLARDGRSRRILRVIEDAVAR